MARARWTWRAGPARASPRCSSAATTCGRATSRRRWSSARGVAWPSTPLACSSPTCARCPKLGAFGLVTCLDDAVNYLLSVADLVAAFKSVARLLAPDGVYLFDTNTLATYRAGFAEGAVFERPLAGAVWRGETAEPIEPGALCLAAIELHGGAAVSRHVQRHHPERVVRRALTSAGLACRAVLGQSTGGVLHEDADEEAHTKLVYMAGRAGLTCHRDRRERG